MVPPLYLIDSWVPAFRPGRIIADRIRNMDLPAGTDSVNLPKVATGTTAYAQGAATSGTNASLTSTDLTTATVTAPVNTYYGQLEASLQLLEQSPVSGGMDQVIFQDLQAAYDQALDAALLYGTGASGQHKGVLTYAATVGATTGSGSWTRTSATTFLNAGGVFNTLVSAVNQVETNRFAAPTAVWVHPRRANSFGIQLDTSATGCLAPSISARALAIADCRSTGRPFSIACPARVRSRTCARSRALLQIHGPLTAGLSSGVTRSMRAFCCWSRCLSCHSLLRCQMLMLQPRSQPGQTDGVGFRYQTRAWCSRGRDSSAPTGQMSITLSE
jgi:hypothetical protein